LGHVKGDDAGFDGIEREDKKENGKIEHGQLRNQGHQVCLGKDIELWYGSMLLVCLTTKTQVCGIA
jgi:hypothetical protein